MASTQRDLILRRLERLSERVDSLDRAMQKIATIVEGAELKKSLKVSTLPSTAAPDQTHKLDAPISADDVGERTIHFMYGLWDDASKPMPGVFNTNMATWKRLNPGWTVKLWHLKDIKEVCDASFFFSLPLPSTFSDYRPCFGALVNCRCWRDRSECRRFLHADLTSIIPTALEDEVPGACLHLGETTTYSAG